MIGRVLLRFILVPLGAVTAVAAAGALIAVSQWNAFESLLGASPEAREDYLFAFALASPLLFSVMSSWAHYTFVPAFAAALAAEVFAIRSVLFHAGNGAVCALLGWSLTRDLREEQHFMSNPTVLVGAGIAAGFVYWVVAGSTAGFWKPLGASRTAPPEP